MKKVLVIMAVGLLLGLTNITVAQAAIVINGTPGTGEWVGPYMFQASDINEPGVDNEHDIKSLLVQWDTSTTNDVFIRTDMWGTPDLSAATGWANNSYVGWQFDFNNDGIGDLNVMLVKEETFNAGDGAIHYYINGTEYVNTGTTKYWGMASIYEVMIPYSIASAYDTTNAKARVISESASTSGDDNLPGQGWQPKTPEPGSAMLLGMGLLSIGGIIRRKFMA